MINLWTSIPKLNHRTSQATILIMSNSWDRLTKTFKFRESLLSKIKCKSSLLNYSQHKRFKPESNNSWTHLPKASQCSTIFRKASRRSSGLSNSQKRRRKKLCDHSLCRISLPLIIRQSNSQI